MSFRAFHHLPLLILIPAMLHFPMNLRPVPIRDRPLDGQSSMGIVPNAATMVEEIRDYLWKNVSYEPDRRQFGKENVWQEPDQFLHSAKGDCEDFALFYQNALKPLKANPLLISIQGQGRSHAVTLLRTGGTTYVLDGIHVRVSEDNNLTRLLNRHYAWWENFNVLYYSETLGTGRILSNYNRIK